MLRCIFVFIPFLILFNACSTKGSYWPNEQRWQNAVANAVTHPCTWIPAAGAAAISAGGMDYGISDWARETTPIFGSEKSASQASDDFRMFSRYGMIVTTLLVYDRNEYWIPMAERMALAHVSSGVTGEITDMIKKKTARERPNSEDKRSFVSGHTSSAFAYVAMSNRNIDQLFLSNDLKNSAKIVQTSFGALTAWARVEAGAHYPTDVLAGVALGNFIAILLHDAFLGNKSTLNIQQNMQGTLFLTFQKEF